jgi:hypothetical protein
LTKKLTKNYNQLQNDPNLAELVSIGLLHLEIGSLKLLVKNSSENFYWLKIKSFGRVLNERFQLTNFLMKQTNRNKFCQIWIILQPKNFYYSNLGEY